jgi:hypothetical protein
VSAAGTAEGVDEQSLARDMIEVHGAEAAVVARDNAHAAAMAGQRPQARYWIRVLGIIQQRRIDNDIRPEGKRPLLLSTTKANQG